MGLRSEKFSPGINVWPHCIGIIFHGECPWKVCGYVGCVSGSPVQDYKFLRVAVTICAPLVNTQTDRQLSSGYVLAQPTELKPSVRTQWRQVLCTMLSTAVSVFVYAHAKLKKATE